MSARHIRQANWFEKDVGHPSPTSLHSPPAALASVLCIVGRQPFGGSSPIAVVKSFVMIPRKADLAPTHLHKYLH